MQLCILSHEVAIAMYNRKHEQNILTKWYSNRIAILHRIIMLMNSYSYIWFLIYQKFFWGACL